MMLERNICAAERHLPAVTAREVSSNHGDLRIGTTYVLSKIGRSVHDEAPNNDNTSSLLSLCVGSNFFHSPRVVKDLHLAVIGILVVAGALVTSRRVKVPVMMMPLLVHMNKGFLNIARTRGSKAGGETKAVEDHDNPFGGIPIGHSGTRTEVVGECVLYNSVNFSCNQKA